MKIHPLHALCVALTQGACAGPTTLSATAPTPRMVTIAATATLHLPPDRAAITLVFGANNTDLAAAHSSVERARRAFVESASEISARLESGTVQYSQGRRNGAVIDEFHANQTIVVHTAEFDEIPNIIRLAASDLTSVSVRYYVDDMTQHRSRIREMATEAAKQKAEDLAEGFDASLGEVLTIGEGNATPYAFGVGNAVNDNRYARVEASESETPAPGAIPLRITLNVSYALD